MYGKPAENIINLSRSGQLELYLGRREILEQNASQITVLKPATRRDISDLHRAVEDSFTNRTG